MRLFETKPLSINLDFLICSRASGICPIPLDINEVVGNYYIGITLNLDEASHLLQSMSVFLKQLLA